MGGASRVVRDLVAEAQIPPDGITSRTLLNEEHAKVVLFGFDAGQELSEHTASMPAIIHVVSGEGTLTLGDERLPARPGLWVSLPANMPHSLTAATPLVMLLTLFKSARAPASRI